MYSHIINILLDYTYIQYYNNTVRGPAKWQTVGQPQTRTTNTTIQAGEIWEYLQLFLASV